MSKDPDTGPMTDFKKTDNPAIIETEKGDDEKDAVELTKELLALFERTRFMAPELWRPRAAELVDAIAMKIGLVKLPEPEAVEATAPVVRATPAAEAQSDGVRAIMFVVIALVLAAVYRWAL